MFTSLDWSLHNPLKGWTLHRLSLEEAQKLVHTMSLPERKVSWAWITGWSDWRSLGAEGTELLFKEQFEDNELAPTLPANRLEDEITEVHVEPKKENTIREHLRIKADLSAEVILGSQSFKTRTTDYSEGGIRFKDALPDWVAGYFTVIVQTTARSFEVTCILVEDQKIQKTRVEIVETEDEESQLPAYKAWVLSQRGSEFPI